MGRNSETKQYPSTKSGEGNGKASGHSRQKRKRSAKQIVLAVTIAVLVALVLTAVVFVIRDMVLQERNPDPEPSVNPGTSAPATSEENPLPQTPDADPSKHPAAHAIDGNDDTYMISDRNQTVGSCLLLELGEETDIMSLEILSRDAQCYIRRADVQTSADKVNWDFFDQFSCTAGESSARTVSKGVAVKAKYLRIVLTEKADAQWLVNTVRVLTQDNISVNILRAEISFVGSSVVTEPSVTTAANVPGGYQAKVVPNSELYAGDLIVVNAKHQYPFPPSTASILALYDSRPEVKLPNGSTVMAYKVGGSTLPALQASALKAFNSLALALVEDTGITEMEIGTNDAWRSRDTQDELYKKYPTTASPAGYSEHNTGLGININLMTEAGGIYKLNENYKNCTTVYNWLKANAHKFGFVERFQTAKKAQTGVTDDFHFRYVGYPHAYFMKENNLCLEEYVEALHAYTYNGNHLTFTGDNGTSYEIYYVPMDKTASSTQLYVPSGSPYTVSGDNYSGFIITVTK